jgi:site-specific DNA-cytosine methylase
MQDRTKRLSRLGNAVVPDCSEWIARRLAEFDEAHA